MNDNLYELTIQAALAGLRGGEFSAVELTQSVLGRIESVDGDIQAYLTVTSERALAQAEAADAARRAGEEAPVLGIPLAIKDVLATADVQHDLRQQNPGRLPPALHGHCG